MSLSYSDVFSLTHERGFAEDIRPGDVVRTGANQHPRFIVVAVDGDKAWVRNLDTGADGLTLLDRCRRIAGSMAIAAE